jgi:hypothetical protein
VRAGRRVMMTLEEEGRTIERIDRNVDTGVK